MSKLEDALHAASDTKALRLGDGALSQISNLFEEQFPGKKAIVIADSITYGIAGKRVAEYLKADHITQDMPFIFNDKDLYAEYHYIDILVDLLQKTDAIPIAVGSGTINDLVKLSSHLTGRHYICVGTAASMDGYTSYGASITKDGAKQTFSCPAPQAWLGDTNIICDAPEQMTAAGYADLCAKVTAGADWILSDRLGIEPIDKKAWNIVQSDLRVALGNPKAIREHDTKAMEDLIEGLILSGFAMQAHRSSRPASGADHQFSHLWNMEHHTNHGAHVSHGFQVSIGTLASTALYEMALQADVENIDIQKCCNAWPTADELAKESRLLFEHTDFPTIGETETRAKYIDRQQLATQIELLKSNWRTLKEELSKQLIPFEELKSRLKFVGAPVEPEEIGVSRDYLHRSYIRAQYIRRRFTILDLAVRLNKMEEWTNALFTEGGRWYK